MIQIINLWEQVPVRSHFLFEALCKRFHKHSKGGFTDERIKV